MPYEIDVTYGEKSLTKKHSHANLEYYRDYSDLPNNGTQKKVAQDLRGKFWSGVPARSNKLHVQRRQKFSIFRYVNIS